MENWSCMVYIVVECELGYSVKDIGSEGLDLKTRKCDVLLITFYHVDFLVV